MKKGNIQYKSFRVTEIATGAQYIYDRCIGVELRFGCLVVLHFEYATATFLASKWNIEELTSAPLDLAG